MIVLRAHRGLPATWVQVVVYGSFGAAGTCLYSLGTFAGQGLNSGSAERCWNVPSCPSGGPLQCVGSEFLWESRCSSCGASDYERG